MALWGGIFNLVLIICLILVFVGRPKEALIWAGIGGIILDLLSGVSIFGAYTLSLVVICLASSFLVKKFFTSPNIFVASIFFFFASIILDIFWLFVNFNLQILLFNAIYNTIVGIILYIFLKDYLKPREMFKFS